VPRACKIMQIWMSATLLLHLLLLLLTWRWRLATQCFSFPPSFSGSLSSCSASPVLYRSITESKRGILCAFQSIGNPKDAKGTPSTR
jgi:hypothetical protein